MRLLLLSFYYPPDLSAGSFRASALVTALLAADPTLEIDVVTTLPNRYSTYSSDVADEQTQPRLRIRRIRLPAHRSGMRDQSIAFLAYARATWRFATGQRYDLVYATSSRLMTAVLGALVSRLHRAPLYLDIRDIFVDTIKDVLPGPARLTTALLSPLERFAIGRASAVNLVSEGFREYFEPRYPNQRFRYFTNGVDDEFLDTAFAGSGSGGRGPVRVLYAGNIGEGQGLHQIVPDLAATLGPRVGIRVLGDGGRREQLASAVASRALTNVELAPPVSRDRLIAEYDQADVLFLHLNDYPAFLKVLPSKLFEYAATGKPILAGLAGYPARFAAEQIENAGLFAPCDAAGAIRAFEGLRLAQTDRSAFVAKYRRRNIMDRMAADILGMPGITG